ncbi:MAG: hypothetical protein KIB07_04355, partial [Finegoldia magna]
PFNMFCLVTYILTQLISYELFYVALVMINYLLKSKKSKKTLIFLRKKLYNNGEIEYKEIVNFM